MHSIPSFELGELPVTTMISRNCFGPEAQQRIRCPRLVHVSKLLVVSSSSSEGKRCSRHVFTRKEMRVVIHAALIPFSFTALSLTI